MNLFGEKTEEKLRSERIGLRKREEFFEKIRVILNKAEDMCYCLVAIDIEHFKLFNEWYGREAGDDFLINVGKHIAQMEVACAGVAGYMGEDDFCILMPNDLILLEELMSKTISCVKKYGGNSGFLPAFGVYLIDDVSELVNMMYDRACIAVSVVKGNYVQRVCWYDRTMIQKMEENHQLLKDVQRALDQKEFTFYAQPKCNLITGKIVGLESLVRWEHPQRGIVSPGEFIPVLEEHGFITTLDLYVWELVCIYLREWLDAGHRALPISVNVSRLDIYNLDVKETFVNLAEKYQLDPYLLEVEITESTYAEEHHVINGVVEGLRESGFTVLMDDFGSGYSSLNMLKDVNVDVLKIDMKFLEMGTTGAGKSMGILGAIIGMAQLMEMRLIAEGVETEEQRELLLDVGCLYAQGYYYYRPLPISELNRLLLDEDQLDYRGIKAKRIEHLSMKELLNGDILSETIINNILGGVAFYDVCDDHIRLLRANHQYCKIIGSNPIDLEEVKEDIIRYTYEEDHGALLMIFELAKKNLLNGAEGNLRRYDIEGSVMWIHLKVFFLKEQDGHKLYYGAISNITDQWRGTNAQFMKVAEVNRKAAELYLAQINPGGMLGAYCEKGYPLYFANDEMIRFLGYESYEEMFQAMGGRIVNAVHPEDIDHLEEVMGIEHYIGYEYMISYRMAKKDGSWFWALDKGRVVESEDGRQAFVSACVDISETMCAQQELEDKNEEIIRQNEELQMLSKRMESILRQAGINSWDWNMNSKTLVLAEGGVKEKSIHNFPDCILEMDSMVAQYKNPFLQYLSDVKKGRMQEGTRHDLPIVDKAGTITWYQVACELIEDAQGVPIKAVGYYVDITEQKIKELESKEHLKALEIDALTGLYNRQTAVPRIKEYLHTMAKDEKAAVLMFDMDNFKLVNDVFGHLYGDSLITENAQKLRTFFREDDIMCRIGGDEFLVLCKNIQDKDVEKKLDLIIAEMIATYQCKEKTLHLSMSAGYALVPNMGLKFDELYKKADIALFSAKLKGKGGYCKYHSSMKEVRYELGDKSL